MTHISFNRAMHLKTVFTLTGL